MIQLQLPRIKPFNTAKPVIVQQKQGQPGMIKQITQDTVSFSGNASSIDQQKEDFRSGELKTLYDDIEQLNTHYSIIAVGGAPEYGWAPVPELKQESEKERQRGIQTISIILESPEKREMLSEKGVELLDTYKSALEKLGNQEDISQKMAKALVDPTFKMVQSICQLDTYLSPPEECPQEIQQESLNKGLERMKEAAQDVEKLLTV